MSLNLYGQLVSSQLVTDQSENQPLLKRPRLSMGKTPLGPKSCQSSVSNFSPEVQTAICRTASSPISHNTGPLTVPTAATDNDFRASNSTSLHSRLRNVQYNKAEGSSISTWDFQNLCDQPVEYLNKLNATILSVLLLGNMILSTNQLLPEDGPLSSDWCQAVLYAARTGYSLSNEFEGGARPLTVDEASNFILRTQTRCERCFVEIYYSSTVRFQSC